MMEQGLRIVFSSETNVFLVLMELILMWIWVYFSTKEMGHKWRKRRQRGRNT